MRVGIGHDTHRLQPGGPLRLGGVDIPHDREAIGHSDGDALLHAVIDALLGAAALGDVGQMFPDTDAENRGRDSAEMLPPPWRPLPPWAGKSSTSTASSFCPASQAPPPSPDHSPATGRHPRHRGRARRPQAKTGEGIGADRPRGGHRRPVRGTAGSEGIMRMVNAELGRKGCSTNH